LSFVPRNQRNKAPSEAPTLMATMERVTDLSFQVRA
jgi:hypothetical protein